MKNAERATFPSTIAPTATTRLLSRARHLPSLLPRLAFLSFLALLPLVAVVTPVRADERLVEFDFRESSDFTPINGEHSTGGFSLNVFLWSWYDFGGASGRSLMTLTNSQSLESARANESSIGFMVIPEAGWALNLTSLTYDMAVYESEDTVAVGGAFAFGSPDGYTSLLGASSVVDTTQNHQFAPLSTQTVDLWHEMFQGITQPVSLRLYLASTDTTDAIAFDNIRVSGTAVPLASSAVPEPGTLASLVPAGLLLLAGAVTRRPRRARQR